MSLRLTYRALIDPIPPKLNLSNINSAPSAPLCEDCASSAPDRRRAVRNRIATPYDRIDTYPHFPLLKAGSTSGCGLCRILRTALRKAWAARPMEERGGRGALHKKDEYWDDLWDVEWDGKVRIWRMVWTLEPFVTGNLSDVERAKIGSQRGGMLTSLAVDFGPASSAVDEDGVELHGDIGLVLAFKTYDSIDMDIMDIDATNQNFCRRLPSTETLSKENVQMILEWISECKTHHLKCRLPPSSSEPWLPTRLLDVGSDNGPEPHLPRVVETRGIPHAGLRYAALSHMWGDAELAPPLRTMQHNYDSVREAIQLERLPQNFFDAIYTCRSLGIQYIWIDSLCIIQDSVPDWEGEAGEMHMVYKNAELMITATSANSAHDGFLARNISMVAASKFQYAVKDGGGATHTIVLTPIEGEESGLRYGDVDGSRWNTRGWTMQERSLSTRSVHFCKNKIYFECRSTLRSEENEPEQMAGSSKLWPREIHEADGGKLTSGIERNRTSWYDLWRRAVVDYSRRRLTVESDKLKAIQSIANEMQPQVSDVYISQAGMWLGNISREILWYVESGIARQPRQWRAPTWSWASLDANIGFVKGNHYDPRGIEVLTKALPLPFKFFDVSAPSATGAESLTEHRKNDLFGTASLDRGVVSFGRVQAYTERIGGIRGIDSDWVSFPYEVLDEHGDIFAHGILDLDNRDNLLASLSLPSNEFRYLHVAHDQHPSGLIIQKRNQRGRCYWERVGVATIFETRGSLVREENFRGERSQEYFHLF